MNLPLFCQMSQRATLFYYACSIGFLIAAMACWFYPGIAPLY